jgi:hypothetical protein
MVALFLFALIEREARRVVQQSGQVVTGSLATTTGGGDVHTSGGTKEGT